MALLPVALAETWSATPGAFSGYPTQLPRFVYARAAVLSHGVRARAGRVDA